MKTIDSSPPRTRLLLPALATLALLAGALRADIRKDDRAYNSAGTGLADWMSWVPDQKLLSELSLPGTHDAIAYTPLATLSVWGQTQTWDLRTQLENGIRVFDIRISRQGDEFRIYHGATYLGVHFDEVLQTCNGFLDDYPTETLILNLSDKGNEPGSGGLPDAGTIDANTVASFEAQFLDYRSGPDGGKIWIPAVNDPRPTLGDVRGKIVIVTNSERTSFDWDDVIDEANFNGGGYADGAWASYAPKFEANSPFDIETKEVEFLTQLDKIDNGDPATFYTCSLNVSGLIHPALGADGGSFLLAIFGQWDGLNTSMLDFLMTGQQTRSAGIVMMDYPGRSLVSAIVGLNMKHATDAGKLAPDFSTIVRDINYGTSDRGSYWSGSTDPGDVAGDLYDYLSAALPNRYWQIAVARNALGYYIEWDGLFGESEGNVDETYRVVWDATSLSNEYTDGELAAFLNDSTLKSLSGDEVARAADTHALLKAQFPKVRWNVLVKKNNFGGSNWTHSDYGGFTTYFKSAQYTDNGNDYVTVAWAGSIDNDAPVIGLGSQPFTGDEGGDLLLDASPTYDPDGDALTYLWDLDGNGTVDLTTDSPFAQLHTDWLADEGTYNGTLTVDDGIFQTSAPIQIVRNNVPPSVDAGGDEVFFIGETFSRTVTITDTWDTTFTARTRPAGTGGWNEIPVNPDGTFVIERVAGVAGSFGIEIEVDDGTDVTTSGFGFDVLDLGSPTFQSLVCVDDDPKEGELHQYEGRFYSTTWPDGSSVTIDWGDGSPVTTVPNTVVDVGGGRFSFTVAHRFLDNSPPAGFDVTISNPGGVLPDFTTPIRIGNVAPAFPSPTLDPVVTGEGLPVAGMLSFSDPGADTWTVTIRYGDGTDEVLEVTNRQFLISKIWDETGSYKVEVVVRDDDGDPAYLSIPVTVTNVEPVVQPLSLEQQILSEGDTAVVTGTVSSEGLVEAGLEIRIDWGDGSPPTLPELGPTSPPDPTMRRFTASHRYWDNNPTAVPVDTYRITATAIDMEGDPATSSSAEIAVKVNNVRPTLLPAAQAWTPIGVPLFTIGSFTDPGRDIWTGQVDYGDGSPPEPLVLAGTQFVLTHTYANKGLYTVTVGIGDDDGANHVITRQVLVDTTFELLHPDLTKEGDANGNGQSNFLDYALGGDPNEPNDPSLQPRLEGDRWIVGYRTHASDVMPRYQKSPNLQQWQLMQEGPEADYTILNTVTSGPRTTLGLQLHVDPQTHPRFFFRQNFPETAP